MNKDQIINENKVKELFFRGDYEKLAQLGHIKNKDKISLNQQNSKEKVTLFYPGSGTDILTPLIYMEKLFPEINKFQFILIDTSNHLAQIKTILDDVGISFEEKNKTDNQNFKKNKQISFYWKNQLIKLNHLVDNAFQKIEDIEPFDIYFEKSFRIMKDDCLDFEDLVVSKLKKDGFIISDSGFLGKNLIYFNIPKEFSSYHEMVLAQKSSKTNNNSKI